MFFTFIILVSITTTANTSDNVDGIYIPMIIINSQMKIYIVFQNAEHTYEPYTFSFNLNFERNFTLISHRFYPSMKSPLCVEHGDDTFIDNNTQQNISIRLLSDNIRLNNSYVNNYYYYMVNKEDYIDRINSCLSLASSFTNNNYNIIHLLKSNGSINQAKFYIEQRYANGTGVLYIGATPLHVLSLYPYNYNIHINTHLNRWNLHLRKVALYTHSHKYITQFHIDTNAYITSNTRNIKLPYTIANTLINDIYIDYINNGICERGPFSNHDSILRCKCASIHALPTFVFEFTINTNNETFPYYFTAKDIFTVFTANEWCYLMIETNTNANANAYNEIDIQLGLVFYYNHLIEFNYETSSITLHSKTQIHLISPYHHIQTQIMLYIIVLMCINIIIISLTYIINQYKL